MAVTETQYTLAMQRHGTPEFTDEDREVQEQWLMQREEERAMAIRATDDEALATELWGDNKEWNDELRQFVPTEEEGDDVSAGNSTERSSKPTVSSEQTNSTSPRPTVPTTVQGSNQDPKGSSTVPSTGGPGKDKK
jgi:hypothetical protein